MQPNKILEARKAKGWTQQDLAERMGTSQQVIQRYETGARNLKASVLVRLSEVLGVTVAYLLGMTDGVDDRMGFVGVPLYGSIAAGRPIEMEATDTLHPVPITIYERWPSAFLLRVEGDSMNRVLPNGSYALVNPCSSVDHDGQPYALRINDRNATIKRVFRVADGYELRPDSTDPHYQPQIITPESSPVDTVAIIGRVVWHCIPYDWSY